MSKLKSAGQVSVLALLVYFAAPTSHLWPGGIQPANAIIFVGGKTKTPLQAKGSANPNPGTATKSANPKLKTDPK
jgi:hypothetical protein